MNILKEALKNSKSIIEGLKNSLITKETVEEVSRLRMEKCRTCPFSSMNAKLEGYQTNRIDDHCTKCGCNLHLKTRALSAQCPEKFWLKEATQKEEKEITKYLNDESNK